MIAATSEGAAINVEHILMSVSFVAVIVLKQHDAIKISSCARTRGRRTILGHFWSPFSDFLGTNRKCTKFPGHRHSALEASQNTPLHRFRKNFAKTPTPPDPKRAKFPTPQMLKKKFSKNTVFSKYFLQTGLLLQKKFRWEQKKTLFKNFLQTGVLLQKKFSPKLLCLSPKSQNTPRIWPKNTTRRSG